MRSARLKFSVAALILTVLVGCASQSQKSPAATVADSSTASSAQPELVCRTVQRTGTRVGTRICKPKDAWEAGSQDTREAVEKIQRESAHTSLMLP